jgi:polysaccharide deacetylase 2 family uncharacterized protein YibQ
MKKRFLKKGIPRWPIFSCIAWILCGMALLSVLLLDHKNWKKGEPSYIFKGTRIQKKTQPPAKPLAETVSGCLDDAGFPAETIVRRKDAAGRLLFVIETTPQDYANGADALARGFRSQGLTVGGEEKRTDPGRTEVFRSITRGAERMEVHFAWKTAPPEKKALAAKEPARRAKGRVALVVDDMGNSLEVLDELIALGEPITVSVLPFSPHAVETARIAEGKGLEVLLHLPLESLNGDESETGTQGMIRSEMDEARIRELMSENLGQVPHIKGVNNHMGSKVTSDEALMRLILEPIREKGLFFLDSRTSSRSVAYAVARKMNIPAAFRQVFLDADGDNRLIKDRLLELFRLAQKNGGAIGICHPFRETLAILKGNFHLLESYGLEAVVVSRLMTE